MSNLIQELRRRNIFRVAGVYAVVGWLLIQLGIALETSLNLPSWFDTFLTTMVLIGFPIALLLAWAFELTPDGMQRTDTVAEGESIRPQTGRKMDIAIIGGLALVAILIVGTQLMPKTAPPPSTNTAAIETPAEQVGTSIAVLPFADMSRAKDQEYFSDGMAEEILNALVRVPDLLVAGRTSSFAFKGQNIDLRDIAATLNVDHILEGSVRKQGENVRITAQLIRAEDGFHMWSDTYDGTLDNIFDLQENISRAIARELKVLLNVGEDTRLAPRLTDDKQAYDYYLKAKNNLTVMWADGIIDEAIVLLEQAVDLDPQFSAAWAELARANVALPGFKAVPDALTYLNAAKFAANKALALDADNVLAKSALIPVQWREGSLLGAYDSQLQLMRDYPDYAGVMAGNGYYGLAVGYYRSALKLFEGAVLHDPLRSGGMVNLAEVKYRLGDLKDAEIWATRAVNTGYYGAIPLLANIEYARGNSENAITIFLQSYDQFGEQYGGQFRSPELWQLYAGAVFGDDKNAKEKIHKLILGFIGPADAPVSTQLLLTMLMIGDADLFMDKYEANKISADARTLGKVLDPYLAGPRVVRQHKNFSAFAERIGLLAIWQKHGWPDLCRPNKGTDGSNGQFTCD